jgi:hypothetical protein
MKHFLLMIVAVVLVGGCGKEAPPTQPETNTEPTPAEKAAAEQGGARVDLPAFTL